MKESKANVVLSTFYLTVFVKILEKTLDLPGIASQHQQVFNSCSSNSADS